MRSKLILLFIFPVFVYETIAQSNAIVNGLITNAHRDTITCMFSKVPLVNNHFSIKLPILQSTFIEITDGTNSIVGLVDPGDSIFVNADFGSQSKPVITGKGKEKFHYVRQYYPVYPLILKKIPQARQTRYPLDFLIDFTDSIEATFTTLLSSYKHTMSMDSYNYLLGDTKGYFLGTKLGIATEVFHLPPERLAETKSDSLSRTSRTFLGSFMLFNDDYYRSGIYVNTVAGTLHGIWERRQMKELKTLAGKYQYLEMLLPPRLSIPVLTNLIASDIKEFQNKGDLEEIIYRIFTNPADSNSKNYLLHQLNDAYTLMEGTKAPDFILENQNGDKIKISDFAGKVVYMDFWFDACGPCHAQFQNLKPVKEFFKDNKEVVFLNISIDNQFNWQEALKKRNIGGMHVYTENRENDHPVVKDYKVYGYPTTRIVGKTGDLFDNSPSHDSGELIKQIQEALNVK